MATSVHDLVLEEVEFEEYDDEIVLIDEEDDGQQEPAPHVDDVEG